MIYIISSDSKPEEFWQGAIMIKPGIIVTAKAGILIRRLS
jgi:hypothetical protein